MARNAWDVAVVIGHDESTGIVKLVANHLGPGRLL